MRHLIILYLLILSSCSSFQEAGKVLRNEKTNTTDEFLVKKKEPLIMPPDLNKVPEPDTIKSQKEKDDEVKLKEMFKITKSESDNTKSNSSTENSIIDKIRK
tara:strand:- start:397 stop:702 length:306 start_codon:yes stop_codon:yes gene_type:complete